MAWDSAGNEASSRYYLPPSDLPQAREKAWLREAGLFPA